MYMKKYKNLLTYLIFHHGHIMYNIKIIVLIF